jgi:GntR family transcriptional regulator
MVITQESRDTYSFSIPLYIQIAEKLIARIESGDFSPGEKLPPERYLSEQFGINRMTLRRALKVLESQGLIVRKHGVGTFIAEPKIDRQMEVVYRFTRGIQNRGLTPSAEIISIEKILAEPSLADELELSIPSRVYSILRLRSINQEPVMLESYKIPQQRFPGLEQYDLERRSIYEILENEYDLQINKARQSFEPVNATEFEANLLKIEIGEALMLEKRLSFDDENLPVEFGKDYYRGDRFRFISEAAPFTIK